MSGTSKSFSHNSTEFTSDDNFHLANSLLGWPIQVVASDVSIRIPHQPIDRLNLFVPNGRIGCVRELDIHNPYTVNH
jgi:hypothetical protein